MKRLKKGSFTIECALIYPIILLVLISLVWLLIYMYDKVAIEKSLIHGLLAADYDYYQSNDALKNEIEERINENIMTETIALKDIRISVKAGRFSCGVEAEGHLNIPEGIPFLDQMEKVCVEMEKSRYSGKECIKEVRRLKKIADTVKEETVEDGDEEGTEPKLPDSGGQIGGLPDGDGVEQ